MEYSAIARGLVALGWVSDAGTVVSPSSGFWFDRHTLEADPLRVYSPAARRAHSRWVPPAERQEFLDLLAILESEPEIAAIANHVDVVHSALLTWSTVHGATVSCWDFGYAAVRATARHPLGGIAVVECLAGAPPGVETLLYHWVDDWPSATRRGWRGELRANLVSDLPKTLERAVRLLLEPPESNGYSISSLSIDGFRRDPDDKYWAEFQFLH